MSMTSDRAAFFLACLRADSARLAEVGRLGLAADVPTCPGWTVEDLLRHVATVYLHKIEIIRHGARPDTWPPDLTGRDTLDLYDDATVQLIAELEKAGPDGATWTFSPDDRSTGFWFRRMAQETAVHRIDAELAYAVATPIDRELALDGIDEALHLMLGGPRWAEGDTAHPVDATLRITADGRSWTARLDATSAVVTDGAAGEVSAEIFGQPDMLLRWLWGRLLGSRPLRARPLGITPPRALPAEERPPGDQLAGDQLAVDQLADGHPAAVLPAADRDAIEVAGDEIAVRALRGRLAECTT